MSSLTGIPGRASNPTRLAQLLKPIAGKIAALAPVLASITNPYAKEGAGARTVESVRNVCVPYTNDGEHAQGIQQGACR